MSGMACLRICIEHGARLVGGGVTPARIERPAILYLEAHWKAPRRQGRVSPGAYVLVDPQVSQLDGEELRRMASDLQLRLFGTEGRNDLCMFSFDGDEAAVLEFARLSEDELLAMRDGAPPPPEGRTRLIRGSEVTELSKGYQSVPAPRPVEPAAPAARICWRGVYMVAAQRFSGSTTQMIVKAKETAPLDDAEHMARDFACLDVAVAAARQRPDVHLTVGLRLWSMVRVSLRDAYQARLTALEPQVAARLSFMIYDMPREMPFSAINPIKDLLHPVSKQLIVRVNDPEFYVQTLQEGLVQGVVLNLEGELDPQRLAAVQRFLSQRPQYAARKLRQGVSGLRSRRELELCRDMGAYLALGPVVSALVDAPVAETPYALTDLPYRPDATQG